jgi:predicted transcriptional regulator
MTKYHRWSAEDSNLLHAEIKNSPTNLQVAFKKVARKINVTQQAVAKYYYRTIQKEKHNKLFLTISSKKEATNYKVTRKGKYATQYQPEKTKKSKWKRILEILAE